MKIISLLAAIMFLAVASVNGGGNVGDGAVGGPENASFISSPDSVKAWRTVASLKKAENVRDYAEYYKKSGEGTLVTKTAAAQLSKALLAKDTYFHADGLSINKNCLPEPGYAVTYYKGKRALDLYFCFECDILIIGPVRDADKETLVRAGQVDFDPGKSRLSRAVKRCLAGESSLRAPKGRQP